MKHRQFVVLWLAVTLTLRPCFAQAGLPVIDKPRYAAVLNDIKSLSTQIKRISDVVGAARSTIDSLGAISAGIRDLQGVLHDGVRGLAGDLSASIGLDGVLGTLRDVQHLYDDTQSLIRDVRELPEQAKYQLKQIGIATKDVQEFLKDGLVYDTFNRLGMDDWKEVAKNPVRALETGAFGDALCRAEDYLTPEEKSAAWKKYLESLTEEDKRRMGSVIGPQFAAHLAADWMNDMEKRMKSSLDFRNVGNALSKVVDGPANSKPTERDVASDIGIASSAEVLQIKIRAKAALDADKAASTILNAEKERTLLLREKDSQEETGEAAKAMLSEPQ